MDFNKLDALKAPELSTALDDRGLLVKGLKTDLVERPRAAVECDGVEQPAVDPAACCNETETAAPKEYSSAAAPGGTDAKAEDAVANCTSAAASTQSHDPNQTAENASAGLSDSAAEVGTKRNSSAMGESSEQAPAKKPTAALPHDPDLPHPWQAYLSQRTGKTYWYNPDTKETTWMYPGQRRVEASAAAPAAVQVRAGSYGGIPAPGAPALAAPAPIPLVSKLVPATNAGTGQLPIRPGAVKCKHFLRFGVCKYGEDCRFDHPPDEAGSEFDPAAVVSRPSPSMLPNGMAQTGGLPLRPTERECSYFMKTGMCKYGESCRWHHPAERQTSEVRFVKPDDNATTGTGANMGNSNAGVAAMGGPQVANEWEMHMSDEGRPYYYNTRTQESTWNPPPGMMGNMMNVMGGMMGMPGMPGMGGGVAMAAAAAVAAAATAAAGGGGGGGGGVMGLGAGRGHAAGLVAGQHPIRPGAADCPFYVKTGSCKFGDGCKFNHPPEMLGSGAGGSRLLMPGGGPGRAQDATGMKKVDIRSEMSTMVVGQPLHVTAQPAARTAEGYPIRPGMPDCSFYMKTGQCKFHDSCKFNHPHKGVTGLPDASGMAKAMGFAPMGM